MSEGGKEFPPLRAGRRAAGLALLGWLDDERAPRLCRVAGAQGAGKSHLLAWLVAGCTAEATPASRRIHVVLPAEGLNLKAAVWLLGNQLDTIARTPQDVLAALTADDRPTVVCVPELNRSVEPDRLVAELLDPMLAAPNVRLLVEAPTAAPEAAFTTVPDPAVLDLDDPRWTDRERFAAWCARQEADPEAYPNPARALGTEPTEPVRLFTLLDEVPDGPGGAPDLPAAGAELLSGLWAAAAREGGFGPLLTDPLLYVLPSPIAVTAGVEGADHPFVRAWDAAGPALIDTPETPVRAHILRARLLGTDDTGGAAADRLGAAPGPWTARWAHWEPGLAVTAAPGAGPYQGQWLAADATGSVRVLAPVSGEAIGRVVVPGPKPLRGLTVTASGAVLLLDAWGGTELVVPEQPAAGLEPFALEEALIRLRAAAVGEISTAAAAGALPGTAPALGDASGTVHWYQQGEVRSERLHTGPVTALAALALGAGDPQGGVPLLVSGGYDGTVRLWGPGSEPMAEPADREPCPVTAVAADDGPDGLRVAAAWSNGLVRVRRPADPTAVLDLRLGSPVRALALTGPALLLALADGVLAVDLHEA